MCVNSNLKASFLAIQAWAFQVDPSYEDDKEGVVGEATAAVGAVVGVVAFVVAVDEHLAVAVAAGPHWAARIGVLTSFLLPLLLLLLFLLFLLCC